MKRVTILKTRIAEIKGEQERAVIERTAALKLVAANPKDEAAHLRFDKAVDACKQLAGVLESLEESLAGAETADAEELQSSHRADMLAARDRAHVAVVARVQTAAKIDKALEMLQTALTEWHAHTAEAKRELSLATIGALDHDRLEPHLHDNRLLQLSAVSQQFEHASHVPLALAQSLRRAGICGPVGSQAVGGMDGPIPLKSLIDFNLQAAGAMVLHAPGTVREAAQRAADSFVCMLDNWHVRCNVVEGTAPAEPEPDTLKRDPDAPDSIEVEWGLPPGTKTVAGVHGLPPSAYAADMPGVDDE
ncbi:hypothetical protein [Paraburkholderia caribensis]|uniref:hypothetical protein n=1 Tax=Paraburkholderia caribensis TaxID=75105 RepID=UPI001D065435|nr:hypothetical protein [Paraburkholderia caribensis]